MSKRIGFTLIELLVVVSIIALLLAILLPSLSEARDHAMKVACAANLRGIGIGHAGYVSEHGYAPVMPDKWQSFSRPNEQNLAFLRRYVYDGADDPSPNSILFCPANRERKRTLNKGMHYHWAVGSWTGDHPSEYLNLPLWLRFHRLPELPGGGAILYDGVVHLAGWQNRANNHGWTEDGRTRGGNVLFHDGHSVWEGENHWKLRFAYEGTTYPTDHLILRVWGTRDRFGYGPPNARLYAWNRIWRYLVDQSPVP
jgi:prepilin-type N-terminal cleavage/methylation domain-containing protein/prepilin-type processing-associated H-X9-DG protein